MLIEGGAVCRQRRNSQRSCLVGPSRFGNLDAADRFGPIAAAAKMLAEPTCFHDQVLLEIFAALPIDSGCCFLGRHLAGGQVQVQISVNLVNQ